MKTFSGKWWIIAASLLHPFLFQGIPGHLADATWPEHAKYHLVEAAVWMIALDLIAASIAFWKIPRGATSVDRAILVSVFLSAHLGYFLSLATIPEGAPEATAHYTHGGLALLFFVGLVLEFRRSRASS